MPSAPLNVRLEHPLPTKGSFSIPYPEGKNEGHFFGGMNHTLAVDGNFFRSPRDFTLLARPDRLIFTWNGTFTLPAGTLLNVQAETPGSEYYFDAKHNVTVQNMVRSPLFMVNLALPEAVNDRYWVEPTAVTDTRPLKLTHTQVATARNVVVHASLDNSHASFIIDGEDIYHRPMQEIIKAPASEGNSEGNKAFAQVRRITTTHPLSGRIWIGTGRKLGLPVFLPASGYMLREIISGEAVTGGIAIAGETAPPSPTGGDRRGTYTPPPDITLDGKQSVHLLLSLIAPGNIGIPDYVG